MKILKSLFIVMILAAVVPAQAQTAEEIIANYLENTGGEEAWKNLEGTKMIAKIQVQGMDLPMEMVALKDGRQASKASFQGQEIKQGVFDGETLWSTNFMTMKAEKSTAEETENMKKGANDFPDPFLDYKEKGYEVELVGSETVEGVDTYKVKLAKEPIMVDGKETEDVSFYYFDKENFVPIVVESEVTSGPGKGMVGQAKFSDYQEVEGLYFPFSITQGAKGQPGGQQITVEEIILNPEVEDNTFAFPEGN